MKRIAVFGKPGGGKSTLGRKLAQAKGLELFPLDLMVYRADGTKVSNEEYAAAHRAILDRDGWIIEGLGTLESFWQRLESADTLIYVDLPYWQHYWFTSKRLLQSAWVKPEGWPEGSSVLKGTLASWRYLRLSPRFWTSALLARIEASAAGKALYHLQSTADIDAFVNAHTVRR